MSYISTQAKLNTQAKRFDHEKTNYSYNHKTIADCEETTFAGTLFLSEEQYKEGMALSEKMKTMDAW